MLSICFFQSTNIDRKVKRFGQGLKVHYHQPNDQRVVYLLLIWSRFTIPIYIMHTNGK
jgi:hypothetical protein